MQIGKWSERTALAASILVLAGAMNARAADSSEGSDSDVKQELQALKLRISELESKENENWLTDQRADQIKEIVRDVLADAKSHGQFADGPDMGYKDGFYLQSADGNYKIVANGFVQVRYEYALHHDANTTDSLHPFGPTRNEDNSSGFDVRRARIKLTGNVVSPNIIYKFYGDFYGASTGAFTVLEAYAGYNFNDTFKVKAGAMEVPFTRESLDSDTKMILMSRPEEFTALLGTDTPRTVGVSLYGDIIKDKLNYEVQVNNGVNDNTLRRPDTVGTTPNLDNRMGFYARMNFAGSGSTKDFSEQPDLRDASKARDFVWLLGGAAGYESQSAASDTLPSPQTSAVGGISNGDGPGFKNYTLNGDIFRGTIDWSAKYKGWSFQTAAMAQQINANAGKGASLPLGKTDASFFQYAYYGQAGYMVIPQKLELTARAGLLGTEGYANMADYYTVGANYYIFGENAKLQTDITYAPESAFTDAGEEQLQNTHTLSFRVQFQVMF